MSYFKKPYHDGVAEGDYSAKTSVNKFGCNPSVPATLEDVWDGSAVYEYLADDTFSLMYISSDDQSNDVGITWKVSGIDSDYNYSEVTGTLDGTDARTFVALTSGATDNKWWRIFRAYNTSGTAMTGNLYVSKANTDAGGDGIPDTATDIQAKILIAREQTLMALWTVPTGKTAWIHHYYASTSSAKVTEVTLLVRPFGGVFNTKHVLSINQGAIQHLFQFPISVAAKSDIKVMASAAGAGGIVTAGFDLYYE